MQQSYPFVSTRTLRSCHFEIGKFGEAQLRKQLQSPLYWIQPDRKVLWNLVLVRDYLLNLHYSRKGKEGKSSNKNRLIL
jgi:hypothetical protein